ncbi:MAG: ComF family protein [Bacteroidales bacterium]|nr:ComF family protein [Bacteroidales bacterium]
MSWVNDFFSLFYPDLCQACGRSLTKGENCLCSYCRFHLPRTNFHLEADNALCQVFWGRVPVKMVTALFFFNKGGKVQHLIHQFKYKGNKNIGFFLGQEMGNQLKDSIYYKDISIIVPVPLHPKKEKLRGFNQSEVFAQGISDVLKIPVITKNLVRNKPSETQTRKSRFRRWQNVETIFSITDVKAFENKKILLVDDVITTGATLEACAHELLKSEGAEIYIAAIAAASH